MAEEIQTLAAAGRPLAGKGPARAVRRNGLVPAIIYGNDDAPLPVSVERKALELALHQEGFFTRLLDVAIDGRSHRVLPREVQYHPVTDTPLHVDFLRFSADRMIAADVPVRFENEDASPGLKRGGVLNVVRHAIEVQCTADRIPQVIVVDLSGYDIGDAVHASSVALPEAVRFSITDRDFTIATIAAPTVVAEEAAEDQAAETDGEAAPAADAPADAPAETADGAGAKSEG